MCQGSNSKYSFPSGPPKYSNLTFARMYSIPNRGGSLKGFSATINSQAVSPRNNSTTVICAEWMPSVDFDSNPSTVKGLPIGLRVGRPFGVVVGDGVAVGSGEAMVVGLGIGVGFSRWAAIACPTSACPTSTGSTSEGTAALGTSELHAPHNANKSRKGTKRAALNMPRILAHSQQPK